MNSSHFETLKIDLRFAVLSAVVLLSWPAQAELPIYLYDFFPSADLINPKTSEVDLNRLARLRNLSNSAQFHIDDYVPSKESLPPSVIGPSKDYFSVRSAPPPMDDRTREMLQKTMQNILDGQKDQFQSVLSTAQSLNRNMKTQMGSQKNAVTMRFEPFSTKAEVAYTGELPVSSSLSYVAAQNEARFEVSKKLNATQTLAYTHVKDLDQQKDLVGIRWSF